MLDLAVKWAVAAAVAAVVTRRVTPANAAVAHRLWLIVLLGPVLWLAGGWTFPALAYLQLRDGVLPEAVLAPHAGPRATLLGAYTAVALLLLLRTLAGVRAVVRLTRRTRPIVTEDRVKLEQIIGRAAHRVREGDLEVPVTAGFVTPLIVLPARWQSLPRESLAAILHHEAAHVRRRDCAVALGCGIVEALFWFHPVAWIAASRVRWFAEVASDAEAARAMDDRDYAAALLTLAAGWTRTKRPRYAMMAGAETGLGARLRLLIDEMEHGRRRRVLLPIAAALVLAGLPAPAMFHVRGIPDATPTMPAHASHGATHQARHSRH